jgi:hypothetical protein
MTIFNYSGAATTYSLFPVSDVSGTLTVESPAILTITFSSSSAGASLSKTGTAVSVGQLMTLTSGTSTSGAAPGGAGFVSAFSCQ